MKKTSKAFLVLTCLALYHSCQDTFTQGQRIYSTLCANCHMDDGSGLNDLIPRLKGSRYLNGEKEGIVCIIKNGIRADSLGLTLKYMPSHQKMTEVEMTNLLNYLSTTFSSGKPWTLSEIKTLKKNCKP